MKKIFIFAFLTILLNVNINAQNDSGKIEALENKIESQTNLVNAIIETTNSYIEIENRSLGIFSTGDEEVDSFIEESCRKYDIDPLLIFAQMKQESAFRYRAISHKGASGLMQLMPATARRFGVKDIYDPQQNIDAGVKYMRWLLDKFEGDVELALAGYNAGEGAVMKYGNRIPPYRETQNYVVKIMNHYEEVTNFTRQTPEFIKIKEIEDEQAETL